VRLAITLQKTKKVHETITFLLVTLLNIYRLKKLFHVTYNKPFLITLLTTLPYLKYVATLPCNSSLITCFLTFVSHKVVWQHMQGVVGLLVNNLLQLYQEIF